MTEKDKPLSVQYKAGYKYQLACTFFIQTGKRIPKSICTEFISLSEYGVLTISVGYAWDGASGPAIDSDTIMRGSLVHDALYQLIRDGLLDESAREHADNLLYDLCVEDGMCKFRAWYVWKAVRSFGSLANKKRVILSAS